MNKLLCLLVLVGYLAHHSIAAIHFDPDPEGIISFPDTELGESSTYTFEAICDEGETWRFRTVPRNDHFTCDRTERTVRSDVPVEITVTFTPGAAEEYDDTLSCIYYPQGGNNFREYWALRGVGTGEGTPRLEYWIDRTEFEAITDDWWEMWPGYFSDLSLENTGAADLDYRVSADVDWLFVEGYEEGYVAPGRYRGIRVHLTDLDDLEPGQYEGNILIESNDPDSAQILIPVTFDCPYFTHFRLGYYWLGGRPSAWVTLSQVWIDGNPAENFDEVGAFNRWDDIVGKCLIEGRHNQIGINVGVEGELLSDGDTIIFRLWDNSAEEEYAAYAHFISGPDHFEHGGRSVVELSTEPPQIEQAIPIRRGWQAISLRIDPDSSYYAGQRGPDVTRLLADYPTIVFAKDQIGQFYVRDRFCNIPYLRLMNGLQVRATEADTMRIRGYRIQPDAQIDLREGWNLAAYYPDFRLTMAAAFRELTDREILIIAKDDVGRFYYPAVDFGGNIVISPNCALWIKITQGFSFHYPRTP